MTETQLVDIFSEVGQVQSFRLMFDRDTGKPKGYGFCTFADHETAASAVRNLNNYDVGGRQLRIDFAEDKDAPPETPTQNSAEQVTNVVQQMDPQQLAEIVNELMTQSNPEQAAMLLQQNPQIAFAVLQALVKMNLVDPFSMQRMLQAQNQYQAPVQMTMPIVPGIAPNPQLAAQQVIIVNKQLVLQLMNLTPEQIQALPLDQQQQVIQLRAQLMGQQ